jgi:hypothetical protein
VLKSGDVFMQDVFMYVIAVADTGSGMTPDTLERRFAPNLLARASLAGARFASPEAFLPSLARAPPRSW